MEKAKRTDQVDAPRGLSAADFTRIAANGFGDPQNAYVHSMAYFNDQIYAGTTRHSMALLKLFPPNEPPAMNPWPVKVPDSVEDLDMRGQIWRWKPAAGRWDKVHTSPLIKGKNKKKVPRELGYRGMAVFQGRSDREPALYVGSMSTVLRGTAARILRSVDGERFTPVSEPGLGNPNISTFRALLAFDDHLFAPPAGEGITFNSNRASVIMRSDDPVKGGWEAACAPGFGDPTNNGIFEMVIFNDHLYAGTFNNFKGYQIWRTPATGGSPCRWEKIIEHGAHRGNLNEIAMSMCVFDGALYVGSAIQNGGYDRNNMVGPAAGEIIRIYPDNSWELIVGTPRRTPEGMKYPLSGMGPGFNNIFAGYIWRMAVHDGYLYASTFDWSVFLSYAGRPSRPARRMMRGLSVEQIIKRGGGFELWRTRDGVNWMLVTQNGLGNPYNYGARTLVSTPYGLFLGTANPFGPEVAAQLSTGHVYIPNPYGGAEVWLGNPQRRNEGAKAPDMGDRQIVVRQGAGAAFKSRRPGRSGRRVKQEEKPARVLITGGAGFIGSRVLKRLLEGEGRVRIFDLPKAVGNIVESAQLEISAGSLTEQEELDEAVRGVETVYHLAALLPGSSYADLRKVNVKGTENLLRACGRAGSVRRFVFTSSVSVYEGAFLPDEWPLTEFSPLAPRGPVNLRNYGASKVACENLVRRYAKEFNFDFVMLRPTICYGVGSKFAEDLIRWVLNNPNAGLGRQGSRIMQLVHVDDLAEAIVQAGSSPEATNEVFNVAGVESFTVRFMANLIRRLAGQTNPSMLRPDRSRTWQRYVSIYDITKAESTFGFSPRVSMHEGFAELVDAMGDRAYESPGGKAPRRRPGGAKHGRRLAGRRLRGFG